MDRQDVIDTDAMARQAQAELKAGYARTDAMAREAQAELETGYARTDAMARASSERTRAQMIHLINELSKQNLMKYTPTKRLRD